MHYRQHSESRHRHFLRRWWTTLTARRRAARHLVWLFAAAALATLLFVPTPSSAGAKGQILGELKGSSRLAQHAVAYLEKVPGRHAAPKRPIEMDQRNHEFVPHALPIVVGSTVRFLNNDNEAHNVFSPDNERYDLGNWTGGQYRDHTFKKTGVYTQLCRLHPSMIGYVVVLQNPYFDLTNSQGRFRIKDVPPGHYSLRVWHERGYGEPIEVDVRAGEATKVEVTMRRGRQ